MKKVLIIEDDEDIVGLLDIHLKDLGYECSKSLDGLEGFQKAKANGYDLIVLDLMLPGMDGLEICNKLRALEINTPILMLTARSEEIDKVIGLESGADDYLTKPFSIREFIARVKAIIRRINRNVEIAAHTTEINYQDIQIDTAKHKVLVKGNRVELTPKEYALLLLLASNPGRSFSREELLNKVWGYEFSGYEHTVNSHVNRLRSKIEPDFNKPSYILTTWGVGYRFNDEINSSN